MTLMTDKQPPTAQQRPSEAWMAYVTNRWSRTVAQPLLITVMLTAFIAGPLTVLQLVIPTTPWHSLTFVIFFIILETIYTTLWLRRPGQRGLSHLAYRSAEFLVLIVLLRLLTWAFTDSWPDWETWQTFLFEPLNFFVGGFFLVATIVVFIVWQMAIQLMTVFGELALDRAEAAYYADAFSKHKLDTRPQITDRGRLIAAFLQQWLTGGLILVFCAALSTFDLVNPAAGNPLLNITRLPFPRQMLLALVFYFLSGFLLLSQGRLALLNARWLINGVQKNERLERSWYRFSLRLLALVAFVAALLPLGSTIALSQIVAAIIQGITAVLTFILALLIGLLTLLFPRSSATELTPPPPAEPMTMPTPAPTPPPTEAAETIKMVTSSAFWAVAIVLTVVAFIFFWRERGISLSLNKSTWQQLWTAVAQWWRSLWQSLTKQVTATRHAIQARRQRPHKESINRPKWRFIRLNALSPRDQLRYFYLSTVKRAGQQGVNRQESETPLEYARDLKENWPEAETDVEKLTDAFLQARYSPQHIEAEQVNPIKEHWQQLRARLRRRK